MSVVQKARALLDKATGEARAKVAAYARKFGVTPRFPDTSGLGEAMLIDRYRAAISEAVNGIVDDIPSFPPSIVNSFLGDAAGDGFAGSSPVLKALQALVATDLATDEGLRWEYGFSARVPFTGHTKLDGLEFTRWDDERLRVSPEHAWIHREFHTVGDHFGCRCRVVPMLVPKPELVEA